MEKTPKNEAYDILLVIPRYPSEGHPNKKNYQYMFPLGLAYISSALKSAGYNVDCLNLNHHDGTIRDIIDRVLDHKKYDFVATGNNAFGYHVTKIIIETAKSHKSRPRFILGGPIITSEPELIFNNLHPDFGILGEGDEVIVELLQTIKENKPLEKVKGIVYWSDRKAIITAVRQPPQDINKIPFPDVESMGFREFLDHGNTNDYWFTAVSDNPRLYSLIGSRSCPYQCTFCYHDNNRYRERSVDNIMEELTQRVKEYKINRIYVFDECFAINKPRLYEFCKRMKKLREEISWDLRWNSSLRVDLVTEDILKAMKDAGCDMIGYGFESFSPEVLKSMKKNITQDQIRKAFDATLKAGIAIQANFIFGDIAETKQTAKETLDYWVKNCRGQVHLDFISPYPSSEIYRHCIKKGIIKDKLDFIKNIAEKERMNMTDSMTDEEFNQLNKEILRLLAKYRKSVKPLKTQKVSKNKYNLTVKCPYCKGVSTYKNCYIKNSFSFSFNVLCRKCPMRFHIASPLRKLALDHYDKTKFIKDFQSKLLNYLTKIRQ